MRARSALLAAFLLQAAALWPLTLEAELGFDGVVASGRWAPLRISCPGAPAGSVLELRRVDSDGGETAVERFDPARYPELECPVPIRSLKSRFVLRLISGGAIRAQSSLAPSPASMPAQLLLALDLPPEALAAMTQTLQPREPVLAREIGAGQLPALALELDGVAGIVLGDTNVDLSPAQADALLTWLHSGGHLVVFGGPGPAALALPEGAGETRLGLGGVLRIAARPEDLDSLRQPAFWREALRLLPFDQDSRIAAGRLPDSYGLLPDPTSPVTSLSPWPLALCLGYALSLLLCLRLRRGLTLAILLSLTASTLILLSSLASPRDSAERGGRGFLEAAGARAQGEARALVFDDGSVLEELRLTAFRPSGWEPLLTLSRARGFSFAPMPGEAGTFKAAASALEHGGRLALLSPRPGAGGNSEFLAWSGPGRSPAAALRERVAGRGVAAVFASGRKPGSWYESSGAGWKALGKTPSLLGRDESWARSLVRDYPDLDFVFARSAELFPRSGPFAPAGEGGLVVIPLPRGELK
ncbi:MAG TPA: hypothetical protein VMC79_10045 [Rectinemataceae bacterium]|nr:hypothetical protein [Rectinemataceae bacterium]